MSLGLLIIRLVVGLTLAAHGTQKLFGWFGGGGVAATSQMFEKIGLRPARVHARLAGLAETCGGVLLAVGLLTPAAAAMILAVMIVAVPLVHLQRGFFAVNGGWEYNLVLAASALGVGFAGPGAFSLDAMLGLSWGEQWGVAALIVGSIAGAAVVLARNAAQHRHAPPGGTPQPQA
jgi:putative oxidoreductase